MTHPNPPDDDSWDELARELGIDEISAKIDAAPLEDEPLAEELGEFEEEGLVEAEPGAGDVETDDGDDAEGDAAEGAEETIGDDQPGTGRKRRRRRRRRRGKGAAGEPTGAEITATPGAETTVADEPSEQPQEFAGVSETTDDDTDADLDAEELETVGIQPAAEEDTGSEVLRELIATWNVPAWDDIVTGLYRPDR